MWVRSDWIRMSLVWVASTILLSAEAADDGAPFWAFSKPSRAPFPAVQQSDWGRTNIDSFILAKLEEQGMAPSPDAPAATLIRRLSFDLLGLPPTPAMVESFVAATHTVGLDQALASRVDRFLGSSQFGERWGRHWLDVARYAESSGKESNVSFPHAWRYRDYVIDSFNADKPFDRFLTEQLAGDLLPYETDQQRVEQLVATGFLAFGTKGLNESNEVQFLADLADEQIDSVTRAVMASTVACARCHDHKSDPFQMGDYYALAGIFGSTKTYFGTSVAPGNQVGGDLIQLPGVHRRWVPNKSMPAKQVAKLKAELTALNQEERDRRAAAIKAREEGKDPNEFFSLRDALRIIWRRGSIEGKLKTVDDAGRAYALAMGVSDREEPRDVPLLKRGEISRPGELVPRGFPIALTGMPSIPTHESGRRQLAEWFVHPDHPLTSRVIANRVWRHVFGAGIVRTVDNFGVTGERPSHPKLLDYLAYSLVDRGWSLKGLIRELVLSRTYRQESTHDVRRFRLDPENRLLGRATKRRLDAEAIRDAMLSVSGRLDLNRPVGSLVASLGDRPISLIAFAKGVSPDLDGSVHRSVYLPVIRDRLPDVLDLFDFAEPSLVTGNRETTNVPLQALYLMNGPFTREQADALAGRLLKETSSLEAAARRAFLLCFSRDPDPEESALATTFFERVAAKAENANDREAMTSYCQALLATAEFRNLD